MAHEDNTVEITREEAISLIKAAIKKKYGTQVNASDAIGLCQVQISRVFNDDWRPISPDLLKLAKIEAITPPTTYRRKV